MVAGTDRITQKKFMRASRSRVWRALTDAGEFARWFGVELEGRIEPGARVEMVTTARNFEGIRFFIDIEKVVPERTYSWRWHPGVPQPDVDYSKEPATLVTFTLEDAESGTLVTVEETGFDAIPAARRAAVLAENTRGWEIQMRSLDGHVAPSA
jgi:uncharacterized protein YndB with AHSA1/START domain